MARNSIKGFITAQLIAVITLMATVCSCSDSRLAQAEALLETDPAAADSILSSIPELRSRRDRALYAILKTQADYKQYKPLTTDSLILTATDYYGTRIRGFRNRRYHSALAWYSQGCVYTELNNDLAAIDAYLKAEGLFPDTLVRYYALTENKLGVLLINRMMLDEAKQQFKCCQINAKRLQDTKMQNHAYFYTGQCALFSKDFIVADSIFSEIINNSTYSRSQKSVATKQLAKINLYYHENNTEALNLINRYLEMTKDSDYGQGLSVKADVFYRMNKYDSAFRYYNESMKYYDELYTRCSNADILTELSISKGNTEKTLYYHNLYGQLRDSINEIERAREIEELKFRHNEELTQETIAHKHRRFTIIGISALLLLALFFFQTYILYKSKERKRIMEKQDQLLRQEEEIRQSSIQVLQARVNELSANDQEARTALLELYKSRLNICRNRFCNTDSFNKLLSFKQNVESCNMNKKEKDELFEQLKLSYAESMTDIASEIPDIKEKEILTILLRHLDLNSSQIADLFSITVVAVKQRIARLTQRAPSDFVSLFSRRS